MAGGMSCTSILESCAGDETEDFEPIEISWPRLVQGIRVYARGQPRSFTSELLQSAVFDGSISGVDSKEAGGGPGR